MRAHCPRGQLPAIRGPCGWHLKKRHGRRAHGDDPRRIAAGVVDQQSAVANRARGRCDARESLSTRIERRQIPHVVQTFGGETLLPNAKHADGGQIRSEPREIHRSVRSVREAAAAAIRAHRRFNQLGRIRGREVPEPEALTRAS